MLHGGQSFLFMRHLIFTLFLVSLANFSFGQNDSTFYEGVWVEANDLSRLKNRKTNSNCRFDYPFGRNSFCFTTLQLHSTMQRQHFEAENDRIESREVKFL